jgi:heme oxygenase
MSRDLGFAVLIGLWLVLIHAAHFATDRSARREAWRSFMAGLTGLSVTFSKARRR